MKQFLSFMWMKDLTSWQIFTGVYASILKKSIFQLVLSWNLQILVISQLRKEGRK